jgi:hypothetical protein
MGMGDHRARIAPQIMQGGDKHLHQPLSSKKANVISMNTGSEPT